MIIKHIFNNSEDALAFLAGTVAAGAHAGRFSQGNDPSEVVESDSREGYPPLTMDYSVDVNNPTTAAPKHKTFKLLITVDVVLNGAGTEDIEEHLRDVALRFGSKGYLPAYSPALLSDWDYDITEGDGV